MFVGHFALGFAAKRVTPKLSLAMLFVAAQLADLLWPVLVAFGIEHVRIEPGNTAFTPLNFVSYPYSHSLLLLAIWGVGLGLVCSRFVDGRYIFAIVTALVVSHWLLDFLTHRPDLPLYPGGPKVGLGLWNSVPWTVAIEVTMYVAGVWIYSRCTRPRDGIGRRSFIGLVALLGLAYVANISSAPPPSVPALCVTAIIGAGVTLVLSQWVDRHRQFVV